MMTYDQFRSGWLGARATEETKESNRMLCERYPFLMPRSSWSLEPLEGYDYQFTELDEIPIGWRKAFGLQICEELRDILLEADFLEEYRIIQIKEKYGYLHWYDNGIPAAISEKYHAWLKKYEDLSEKTCIICGKPGKMANVSWISPYCRECFAEYFSKLDYDEYTKEDEE